RASGALYRPERLGGARRNLAYGQRGCRQPLRGEHDPAYLDGDDLGGQNGGPARQSRSRYFCPLRGASTGVPQVNSSLDTVAYSEGQGLLSTTPELLEDLRNGRIVILVDDEDRENEGDLVIPAQMVTPDAINFMAKHGRGLICLAL